MNLGKETEITEFKKSTSELEKAICAIVAMLNKHGRGTLYFGVAPDGEVVGQEIGKDTLNDIARKCKDNIKPMIYPEIKQLRDKTKDYIRVKFEGDEKPYSAFEKYYIRVNDRCELMTQQELRNMMLDTDYSCKWEKKLTNFGIESVDLDALRIFYDLSTSCGRLEEMPKFDAKKLLTRLGLMENNKLNNAGWFLFSNKNPIVLKVAIYTTDEKLEFVDIKRTEGNIFNLINIANQYIKEKINWNVVGLDGVHRKEVPEIPLEAIREIVVNSFAHANYRAESEHEINITPSKIEIYNPGEFPKNLNPEMFVTQDIKSQPRNKIILDALFKCKAVEIFGSGFKKTYKWCNEFDIKTEYNSNNYGFTFCFIRPKFNNNVKNIRKIAKKIIAPDGLDKTTLQVFYILNEHPEYTIDEISIIIKKTSRTVARSIKKLIESKVITRVGSNKKGYWQIIGLLESYQINKK